MKPKTYELTIDSPCSQKLSDMTITGHREHFCSQCAKNVVDMRGRSKAEVYKAYKSAKGELCTILDPEQLDSPFEVTHPNSFLNLAKHAIASIIFFFVTERSHAHRTNKNEGYDYIKNFQDNSDNSSNQILKKYKTKYKSKVHSKSKNTIYINGRIIDKTTSQVIPSVGIKLEGFEDKHTQTDSSGFFRLTLPKKEKNKLKTLEISFLGKETKIDIDKKRFERIGSNIIINFYPLNLNKTTGVASPPRVTQKKHHKSKRHCIRGKVAIRKKEPFFSRTFKKRDKEKSN